MSEDVLAGITPQTTKAELVQRLERASDIIVGMHKVELTRMREIEERVRAKWSAAGSSTGTLYQIIVQGTEAEIKDASGFIGDLEDVAPHLLQRVKAGADTLLQTPSAKP